MSYQPVALNSWGGLNIADDPEEVSFGRAVDALNQDASERGRLRQRPGTVTFSAGFDAPYRPSIIKAFPTGAGGFDVLASFYPFTSSVVYAYTSDGAFIDSIDGGSRSIAVYGDPTYSAAYIAIDGDFIAKYEASGFTADVIGHQADFVAILPEENRLVTAKGSQLRFSEAGDPEDFSFGHVLYLDPGDGEEFQGMVVWRESLFVFKESKFYVFYGSSIDGVGQPIFNYRTVDTTIGPTATISAVTAARDGVFFVAHDGVYRTSGDTPQKISLALDPWFARRALPLATNLPSTYGRWGVSSDARRLYLGLDEGSFVYHFDTQEWAYWDLTISAAGQVSTGNGNVTAVGVDQTLRALSAVFTDDDGTGIDFYYRTGVSDLDIPSEKSVRQVKLWGTGDVTLSVFTDHGATDAGASVVELGTSPAVEKARQRYRRRGTFISLGFEADGPLVIHNAILDVRAKRLEGVL